MNKSEDEYEYIRLLKASFALKTLVWFVAFFLLLIIALIFDATATFVIALIVLNIFGFGFSAALADLIAHIAEKKGIQPGSWFIADIEREKKHYGPLRANRLFGHPIGKKKWF
jgi:hypothetical protein